MKSAKEHFESSFEHNCNFKNISCFDFDILLLIKEKREFNPDFIFILINSKIILFIFWFSGNFSCSIFILSVNERFSLSSKGPNESYINYNFY